MICDHIDSRAVISQITTMFAKYARQALRSLGGVQVLDHVSALHHTRLPLIASLSSQPSARQTPGFIRSSWPTRLPIGSFLSGSQSRLCCTVDSVHLASSASSSLMRVPVLHLQVGLAIGQLACICAISHLIHLCCSSVQQ